MNFTNMESLQQELERRINLAIENTIEDLKEELMNTLDESFYSQYAPKFYHRTYKLLNSAACKMIGQGIGMVYMNPNGRYNNGTLLSEVQEDASYGFHGFDTNIQTEGRYWKDFENLVYEKGGDILAKNLKAQGLDIKSNISNLIATDLEF